MKTIDEIKNLCKQPYKTVEKELNIKIRNGQSIEGVRKTLSWVTK